VDEATHSHVAHVEGRELPSEDIVVEDDAPARPTPLPLRIVFLVVGIGLFVTALGLMKAGAAALVPSLEGSIFTDNAWSALGLGWIGACVVLSGSPVAASALALLDGGAIDRTQSFAMLTGSRLGAAFVVLVVGGIYAVRHRGATGGPRAPLSIGILSLLMTVVAYLPGAAVGYLLLRNGVLDALDIGTSPSLTSLTDAVFGWAVDLAKDVLPSWALFPAGLGVLLLGFSAFDRVLPHVGDGDGDGPPAWHDRKWPMFFAGCGVCLLTLSVSVALTVLVPLVAKGYLRRANTLPYIAGANITTLADTLVAAILLGNQDGVRVVVAVTAAVTLWTLLLLATAYPAVRSGLLGIARSVLVSRRRLAGFVGGLFLVPLVLIAV
jgi:solute carrier family 34 (sodium-dependent phosphate cotransporter)